MNNLIKKYRPLFLGVALVVVMMVPAAVLDATEFWWCRWAKVANLLLWPGMVALLVAWTGRRRLGWLVAAMIPMMVFSAFQLVVTYLFGDGIIGVDMFLNVVTSNSQEIGEVLWNLLWAIAIVVVLYVPVIWGGMAAITRPKRWELSQGERRRFAGAGAGACALGIAAVVLGACTSRPWGARESTPSSALSQQLWPANVLDNLRMAFVRYGRTNSYGETSAGMTYGARSLRPDTLRETFVVVIGETGRAWNWHMMGYGRPTTPRLEATEGVVPFTRSLTESNTTHKSVPLLLTPLTAENFDSIGSYKGFITAFNEAGYDTWFISNQRRNGSYTEWIGAEARHELYLDDLPDGSHPLDEALLGPVFAAIDGDAGGTAKRLVVVHSYGSHFLYRDRYRGSSARFLPDGASEAKAGNRPELLNAYDNTVLYTDSLLWVIAERLRRSPAQRAALFYTSDHGEDIFDDSRQRFLHASPRPTAWQLWVPTLLWMSDSLARQEPGMAAAARANASRLVSPQRSLVPTLLEMAGIDTPYLDREASLVSPTYREKVPVYITDLNEGVPLLSPTLLRPEDLRLLEPVVQGSAPL